MALQRTESNGGDAPLHTPGQIGETSSLGLFWPPKETLYHRKKGFFLKAIQSDVEFSEFKTEWDRAIISPHFSAEGAYSRVTMRAVVNDGYLHGHNKNLEGMIEAAIPLEGGEGNVFNGMVLVYFGMNHPDRMSDSYTPESCQMNREIALGEEERTSQELIEKPKKIGYNIHPIDKTRRYTPHEKVVDDLFKLYGPFNWTREEIVEMLNATNRLIAVGEMNGNIVSAGVAERASASIQFGKDNVHQLDLVELTDAATLVTHEENHEGNGLYSAVSTLLLQEIAALYENSPYAFIVFGESNASAIGVLKAARHQGRTFAHGMLPKHVPILDRGENAKKELDKYNNFYPTYLSLDKLLSKYGHT